MSIYGYNESELESLMQANPNAVFYRVCRKPIFIKGVKNGFALAPSKELHTAHQAGKMTWEEYVSKYYLQVITSAKARSLLFDKIQKMSEEKDVFLVCVCGREKGTECHRFILKVWLEDFS